MQGLPRHAHTPDWRPEGLDSLDPVHDLVVHHREEQLVLAGKVGIDRALRPARRRGDFIHARALEADLGEHLQGCVQQSAAYGLASQSATRAGGSGTCAGRRGRSKTPSCP